MPAALLASSAPAGATGPPSLAVSRAGRAVDGVAAPRWAWPVSGRHTRVRAFEPASSPWGPGHRGVDLPGQVGDPVGATEAGVVRHVGIVAGRGTVTVVHRDGLRSTYEPVLGSVRVGEPVAAGDVLGVLAPGTHCPGPCLHLGAVRDDGYVDPWPLLRGARPVVLLPLIR